MDESKSPDGPAMTQEFKPGDTVTPGGPAASTEQTDSQSNETAPPAPETQSDPEPPAAAQPSAAPEEPHLFKSDEPMPPQLAPPSQAAVTWTASEFIAHDKSFGWYAALAGAAIVLAAIVFLLTRDKISTGVVIVAALALGIYGARKPHQLQYALDAQGVHIGQKYYAFGAFRSFAVIDEGAFSSIAFRPLKRFGQLVTIYFDPKDETAIIELLSSRLPMEPKRSDAVDNFMRKIRF